MYKSITDDINAFYIDIMSGKYDGGNNSVEYEIKINNLYEEIDKMDNCSERKLCAMILAISDKCQETSAKLCKTRHIYAIREKKLIGRNCLVEKKLK